ncbi:MAG: hypothetical protein H6839_04575 [Planctomycetes bacterium]|nr:hypothetical protein [Planctomycetota bacterium]
MRARAQCNCGWQRELSEFYAGKRIRCPECSRVLDVPGQATAGLYNSPLPARKQPAANPARRGSWAGVPGTCGPRRCCGSPWLMIVIVMMVCGMNLWRQLDHSRYETECVQHYEIEPYEYPAPAEPSVPARSQAEPRSEQEHPADRPAQEPAKEPAEEPADDSKVDEF